MTFIGEIAEAEVREWKFDVFVAVCGFETRARYLPSLYDTLSTCRIVTAFPDQQVHSFYENRAFFESRNYDIVETIDGEFAATLHERLEGALAGLSIARVFVDISSQSRGRLADTVAVIQALAANRAIHVVFGYSVARFQEIPSSRTPNVSIGPISRHFAGWSSDPGRSLALIIGIGYEQDRALGAFETLEPTETWILLPCSSEHGYDSALKSANELLLEVVPQSRVVLYDVEDPNATFAKLASLVLHASDSGDVVLLPSGPKILALLSLLVSLQRSNVAVWRVSAGTAEQPINRLPSGSKVFAYARFGTDAEGAQ